MKTAYDIIIRPVITEDSMAMTAEKKYVFVVAKTATKPEIASAVKELFNVDVLSVNTMNMKGKTKRVRYNIGRTASWKKAIVTLKPESKTIEFFDGMI